MLLSADVKSVCTTNVMALSFIWQQNIEIKVLFTLFLNSLLDFAYTMRLIVINQANYAINCD